MKKLMWPAIFLVGSLVFTGCDNFLIRDPVNSFSDPQIAKSPIAIIDRLLPEDGLSRKRLRAVIEATMRVTNINRAELPEQRIAVERVLQSLTQRELEQIERLVPEVEANPTLQWEA